MNTARFLCAAASLCLVASLPAANDANRRGRAPAPSATQTAKLDLNTADEKALAEVPVIGPEVARAIVAARPFASVDQLDRVKGLTAEQLEHIRSVVAVSNPEMPRTSARPAQKGRRTPDASAAIREQPKPDLNNADVKTLEKIASIGPELAREIVAARPFASIDELSRVKGISAERLEQIRAQVSVAPRVTSPQIPAP